MAVRWKSSVPLLTPMWSAFLSEQGYSELRVDVTTVCGLHRYNFTTGLAVALRQRLDLDGFETLLAEQMAVAPHLLRINYQSFTKRGREQIHFPRGWTARKR